MLIFVILYSVSSVMSLMSIGGGIFISLVSLNMLGLWVGAELNFLGAICYMCGGSVDESESVMKYFVVQVFGSCLLILGILMLVNYCFIELVNYMILLGVLVKLGVFPFYFWVPSVMSGLSWFGCFVVSVIQKVVPLWLLSNLSFLGEEMSALEVLAALTCLMGCLGGLGVLSYRVLLAYSSLVHLGFLIILCLTSLNYFWFYMAFYMLLNLCLMGSLSWLSVYCFGDLMKEKKLVNLNQIWWVSLYFFSLAGLPPFSGCILKVFFLVSCWNFMPIGSLLCIFSSAVSLYFYLNVVLNMMIFWGKSLSSFNDKNMVKLDLVSSLSIVVNLVIGYAVFLSVGLW
nr:NADH dehydrogenase subunit 2 [Venus verrucosa]UJH93225.1 NADH dehydrogenase subunit 2 [Venus verrucosa]UJH93251.1 NADH dehydrogenase subunit 2 [Venus verrucosa]UJH93277.1 NADH dehydrogenase subunit 2 [Venus verrucosa]